jgi:hypothetical protein
MAHTNLLDIVEGCLVGVWLVFGVDGSEASCASA